MSKYLEWKKRAILMAAGGWWMPSSFSSDDVLAVYQFKGANSATQALTDLTGHGYDLTGKNFVYSESDGFTGGTVTQDALTAISSTRIKSVVVRYKNFKYHRDSWDTNYQAQLIAMNAPTFFLLFLDSYGIHGDDQATGQFGNSEMIVLKSVTDGESYAGQYQTVVYNTCNQHAPTTGIVGYSIKSSKDMQIYVNGGTQEGREQTITSWRDHWKSVRASNQPLIVSGAGGASSHSVQILAAAFYSVALTDAQHQEVTNALNQI